MGSIVLSRLLAEAVSRLMSTAYTDTMGRTDSFAAPEQFDDNGTVDHRTDIYAVGRIISNLPCLIFRGDLEYFVHNRFCKKIT